MLRLSSIWNFPDLVNETISKLRDKAATVVWLDKVLWNLEWKRCREALRVSSHVARYEANRDPYCRNRQLIDEAHVVVKAF